MPAKDPEPQGPPSKLEELERRQGALWRVSLVLLALLAVGLAALSWESVRAWPQRLEVLALGLVVLLFVGYAWHKQREIAELRVLIRGLQSRSGALVSQQQLLEIISRSQRGYRELIDSLDQAVFTLSPKGEVHRVNLRFAEMMGRPFQQIVGWRLEEFLAEPSRASMEKALPELLQSGFWAGLVRVRFRHSGEVRYLDCVLRTIVQGGELRGISGLARDVTHEREAELRFTELFETLQEGVYFSTPDGQLLDVNPAMVRMLGYDRKEELLRVNARDLYPDSEQRLALVRELEEKSAFHDRVITLRRKDGRTIRCLDTATAIRDRSGNILRHHGTLIDITERLEIERRLQQEQEFIRRLIDSYPDIIAVLDRRGRFTFVSQRIEAALGYPPQELLGRPLGERTHPEDRPMLEQRFQSLIGGESTMVQVEYRTKHKDGSWRTFHANASPLCGAEGKITGVVASARDVTELQRLEQQLIQSEKLVAMGQMIAGVAHELNNPLTAILGSTELLRERAPEDISRRQAELVYQQARRAINIVQDLLAFSQPAKPSRTRLDLVELVQRALHLHGQSLSESQISVDLRREADLPALMGDPNRLIQVFLNLIINAEQAIREIRESGTLRVRFGQSNANLWVSFQDDGVGIRPNVLPKIFDPFFTTKRPGRGTGLGLSICLAIVREHGGNIEVQTPPEGGSIFTVSLPAAGDSRVSAGGPAKEASPVAASLPGAESQDS